MHSALHPLLHIRPTGSGGRCATHRQVLPQYECRHIFCSFPDPDSVGPKKRKCEDIPCLKILLSTSYREIFSIEKYECGDFFLQCFGSRFNWVSGSGFPIRIRIYAGKKWPPKKKFKETSCFKSLNHLCRDLIRHL
jgi:hypothetical protein